MFFISAPFTMQHLHQKNCVSWFLLTLIKSQESPGNEYFFSFFLYKNHLRLLEIFFLVILFLTFAEFSPTKNCNSDYNEYFSKKFAMQENVDLFSCFDIFTSWHTYARKSFTPYFKSSYSLLYTHYSILPLPRPNTSYPLTLYLLFYAPPTTPYLPFYCSLPTTAFPPPRLPT